MSAAGDLSPSPPLRPRPDWPFYLGLSLLSSVYVVLILAMLVADLSFIVPTDSSTFSVADLKDAPAFAAKLRNPSDPVSTYVRSRLKESTRLDLAKWQGRGEMPPVLVQSLVEELNTLIKEPLLWEEARFANVNVGQQTRDLLESKPNGRDLARLNRLLLVDAYPLELLRKPPHPLLQALGSPEIRYSIKLSLISCTLTTVLALWVAVPTGYLMSRHRFPGKRLMDAILDIPIVLPPLVIGLSLLILFQTPFGRAVEHFVPVTYAIPSVILAQFAVACAFAIRTMLVTFDQINPRCEQVALTLGCNRSQAFWLVALPQARRGILTAATLAWARALGEFGPILIFSGATRLRTEVLSTTVFLELSVGNIEAAVAVSLIMIGAALTVLTIARVFGLRAPLERVL